jgi:hypothetical protein
MKSAFAEKAALVGPAMVAWASRAKTAAALLLAKRRAKTGAPEKEQPRRMTAPPPTGALHSAGRKVIRGELEGQLEESSGHTGPIALAKKHKRKIAIGSAVGIAVMLCAIAMHKPSQAPTASATPANAPPSPATPPEPIAPTPGVPAAAAPNAPGASMGPSEMAVADPSDPKNHGKKGKVEPFGNGPVGHPNVIKIKMDGAIGALQGAAQPTGFTVVIPDRRSLEAGAPLAARDPRIASIDMNNAPTGAELTVTFKDGVPNYQVRAKGDVLELALAQPSDKEGHAKHEPTAKKPHGKHAGH